MENIRVIHPVLRIQIRDPMLFDPHIRDGENPDPGRTSMIIFPRS
jgi:hypothetical protein